MPAKPTQLPVMEQILSANDQVALENRKLLGRYGVVACNVMASPGATLAARLVGALSLILPLGLGGMVAVAVLRRVPKALLVGVGMLVLLYGLLGLASGILIALGGLVAIPRPLPGERFSGYAALGRAR